MSFEGHELFTEMLFADAIVGVGFPSYAVAETAVKQGLAVFSGNQHNEGWTWLRPKLEALPMNDLMDLYTGLKLHEVTRHARQ
jgi:hypothetical protein